MLYVNVYSILTSTLEQSWHIVSVVQTQNPSEGHVVEW